MAKEAGFIDSIVGQVKLFFEKLHINKDTLVQMGIAFGMGFLFGFLLKRGAHYVCALIIFLVGLYSLQHFGVIKITFYNAQLAELFSGSASGPQGQIAALWAWISQHAAMSIAVAIGALLGLKNA